MVPIDWTAKEAYAQALTDSALWMAHRDAVLAAEAMGPGPRAGKDQGYYMDEASIYAAELARRGARAADAPAASCRLL